MHDAGFLLISLRPVGGHDALRRAAARDGGQVLAMSPWRIIEHDDAETRRQLREALAVQHIVFTSPAAVRAAARLLTLKAKSAQHVFAVGEGTRRALQRAGVTDAQSPTRMDSEGLLALPDIAGLRRGDVVGLVTAPGGRGEIARQLTARGVGIMRADVYARAPVSIPKAGWQRLQQALDDDASPIYLALTSGEAFTELLAQRPATLAKPLWDVTVLAASERLATLARAHGFHRIKMAAGARPQDVVAAINAA